MNRVINRRPARAFTVLEVVLASVLGLLVVITCAGIFAAIDRSHRRQEQRLDETLQFARAHQTIERALQNIVMVDVRPPEAELEDRLKEQARLLDEDRDLPVDPTSRFALRSDPFVQGSLSFTRDLAVYNMNPQVFELAVRSSPVFGGEVAPPLPADSHARTVADRTSRRTDRHERSERSDFSPATRRADAGSPQDLHTGDPAIDALGSLDDFEDAPRAPGVRGVFELRPDGETPGAAGVLPAGAPVPTSPVRRLSTSAPGEQGWTLWWRELPRRDPVSLDPAHPDAQGDQPSKPSSPASGDAKGDAKGDAEGSRGNRSSARHETHDYLVEAGDQAVRRVPLVSGLKTCRWEAYRRDRRDAKFTATYEAELPSYVALELVSLSGRRENWMFEIGWSAGAEPGSIIVSGGGPGASTDLSGLAGAGGADRPGDRAANRPTPRGGRGGRALRGLRRAVPACPARADRADPARRARPANLLVITDPGRARAGSATGVGEQWPGVLGHTEDGATRRAFAMPLVVLLALVGALAVALLLDRLSVSHLTVRRQVGVYTGHHFSLGIKEVTGRWLTTIRGRVEESLDSDGLAYRLELPDHGHIDVYMEEAQGSALTETTALDGRFRDIVTDMQTYLQSLPPESVPQGTTRPVGPPEISLMTAPQVVLEALAYATVEPGDAPRLVHAIMTAQRSDGDPRAALTTAMSDLDLPDEVRDDVQAMLTTSPVLYRVVAQSVDGRDRIIARSGGLMVVGPQQSHFDSMSQSGAFLSWEELPLP